MLAIVDRDLGIYDTTPDMENTIALCDAYIGDAASSVISLFGIVGKPIFILNNRLHSEPAEDSWKGEIQATFNYIEEDRFSIIQGNRLYVSEGFTHTYKYFCDLSDYVYGGYYHLVYEIAGKLYVCPRNAQNIMIIDKAGKKNIVELQHADIKSDAFIWAVKWWEKYLILLPRRYPAIVKYNIETGKIQYEKKGVNVFVSNEDGVIKTGGCGDKNGTMYLSSPTDNRIYVFDVETSRHKIIELPVKSKCGYNLIFSYKDVLWLLPCEGKQMHILRWNPDTNEIREYDQFPQEFRCAQERPFNSGTFYKDYLYLTPESANMYVRLNIVTGEMTEWKVPFKEKTGEEYFYTTAKAGFLYELADESGKAMLFSYTDKKLYEINLQTNSCAERSIFFDREELKAHEPGFCCSSEWLRYCCHENAFNSIRNFLDGTIIGESFDRNKQIAKYEEIAANSDGTCGVRIHEFMSKL